MGLGMNSRWTRGRRAFHREARADTMAKNECVKTGARTPKGAFHVECEAAGKAMAKTESEVDLITCISEPSLCWAYAWSLWAGLERGVMRLEEGAQ